VTEDGVLAFIQRSIKSVWALELLLLVRRERDRAWPIDELVRELRSSDAAVSEAVTSLKSSGLLAADSADVVSYRPASAELDRMAAAIESTYAAKPLAVVKMIMSAPNEKLRIFADAFKLKDR
jgi:hypothetical protein